jgi:hypothetical protein
MINVIPSFERPILADGGVTPDGIAGLAVCCQYDSLGLGLCCNA